MKFERSQSVDSGFYEARHGFLIGFHLPLQKVMIRYAGPVSVALYAFTAFSDPVWQNYVTLGGITAAWLAWIFAYYTSHKRANLERSVFIFSLSVILFETLETCLIDGTAATALLGNVAVTIYAALFSRKYLYYATAASLMSFITSEILRYVQIYPIKVLPPGESLIVQIIFACLLFFMATYVLRRSQTINESLYKEMKGANETMGDIIAAASQIQPIVDDVTTNIEEISSELASQAAQQAAATTEINASMQMIKKIANNTASSTQDAQTTAELIGEASKKTTYNLQSVQNGFNEVVEIIDRSREKTSEFSVWAENIEGILSANQSISNQIKILSINAAVQAAKAGKYGLGFRVVASEMRVLIGDIDANMDSSSSLLEGIRKEAATNALTIQEGADLLRRHFERLQESNVSMEMVDDSFSQTRSSVKKISEETNKQKTSIHEITLSMDQVNVAASKMRDSSSVLLENVERISESHQKLRVLLESSDNSTIFGQS